MPKRRKRQRKPRGRIRASPQAYRALRRPPIRYWQGETWFFGPRQRVLPLWLRGREFGGDRY
jgi:hypothetical protein